MESQTGRLTLDDIGRQLEQLTSCVATKKDLTDFKAEMVSEMMKMTEGLSKKVDILEGRVFKLEQEKDRMSEVINNLKRENSESKAKLELTRKENTRIESNLNDLEQYGRNWNLRIYKVPEAKEGEEEDCGRMAIEVFEEIGVTVRESDIENSHRVGVKKQDANRPIIVRFHSRRLRDRVINERRKLKGRPLAIGEDLSLFNLKLLKMAEQNSATMAAWTSRGKVLAKLKNGQVRRVTAPEDIDSFDKVMRDGGNRGGRGARR